MNSIMRIRLLTNQVSCSLYALARTTGIAYSTLKSAQRRGGQLSNSIVEEFCCQIGITLNDFYQDSIPETVRLKYYGADAVQGVCKSAG